MDITLLASGSRPWDYWMGRWGLSFLIDEDILFDTFADFHTLERKARRVGVDLSKIRTVVISHDHWDHTGGLWGLLEQGQGIDVYLPFGTTQETKARVLTSGNRVIDAKGVKTVRQGVCITEEGAGGFESKAITEQSVVIETGKGLFVVTGCSHPGAVEIVKKAKTVFNGSVHGIIGGFHLMRSPARDILNCANALRGEGVKIVAPTHCTGWRAERIFRRVFREGYVRLPEMGKMEL